MIQELSDLRNSILEGRYQEALALIEQLDGMSRQAKLGTIESFLVRMLIHLIKNQLEQRLTNYWAASIRGSLVEIKKWNLQDNKTSYYVERHEWETMLEDAMEIAISDASVELFDGAYTPFQVDKMVDRNQVITIAQELLALTYTHSKKELPAVVNDRLTQLPGGEDWKEGRQR